MASGMDALTLEEKEKIGDEMGVLLATFLADRGISDPLEIIAMFLGIAIGYAREFGFTDQRTKDVLSAVLGNARSKAVKRGYA